MKGGSGLSQGGMHPTSDFPENRSLSAQESIFNCLIYIENVYNVYEWCFDFIINSNRMVGITDIESGGLLLSRTLVTVDNIASEIQITSLGIQVRPLRDADIPSRHSWKTLPFAEVLSVKRTRNAILLHTFRRDTRESSKWYPKSITIDFGSKVSEKECMLKVVQDELNSLPYRPKRLLFFINPVSGSKQATYRYARYIEPFFKLADITCDVVETKEFGVDSCCQIAQVVSNIRDSKVSYDGIIGVGGDGLCTKIVNVCSDVFEKEGDIQLSPIRLGHIPCGSTDALCSSVHGTRSMFTSMMHIALGDTMKLDALEITLDGEHKKHSVCIITCGFMADVIRFSDSMRILGPFRYDIAGFIKLAQNKAYTCTVRYIEAKIGKQFDALECTSTCPRCMHGSQERVCTSAIQDWKEREPQEYMSIMVLNTACISDKSTLGMYKYGHLADGCGYLVMVKKCSALHYLQFLLCMSKFGLGRYNDTYVEVIPVFQTEIVSNESNALYWNLDGELELASNISVSSHSGSVPFFGRGVEV